MKRNIFKNADEFRGSDLWNRLKTEPPTVNDRVLRSTRLENMIYNDLREEIKSGLDEIEAGGTEKLSTFPSVIQDTFQSLYSLSPRRNDDNMLTAVARQFNSAIIDCIMSSDGYPVLKSVCEGRELPAYEAVNEFTGQICDKLDDLLKTANVLNNLENRRGQIKEELLSVMERFESGDSAGESGMLAMVTDIAGRERQIERLSEMVSQNVYNNKEFIQSAVASAKEKARETADILMSWGNDASSPEALQQNIKVLQRVQSSQKLKDIAKYLGRYRELLNNARKNSFTYGCGDKYDITLGNDFTRAVSSEYAYLALPETVPLFIQKVQRKTLKQYRKRERTAKGYGDVVVCIDESASMQGNSIAWAKAVALVLLEYAAQNGRNCGIVRFSSKGSAVVHTFLANKYSVDDVLSFAESFLGGGTDFEEPLTKAVELIEKKGFQNADVVFLTDGKCIISDEFSGNFRTKIQLQNFIVTGIVMDKDEPGMTFSLAPFCGKVYRLSEITCDNIAANIITDRIC